MGVFFNRQSAFLWVPTELFSPNCLKKKENKLAWSFNLTFHYTDGVLSLANSKLGYFVDRIYPTELVINDTTDTAMCASYLHLEIDSGPVKNET